MKITAFFCDSEVLLVFPEPARESAFFFCPGGFQKTISVSDLRATPFGRGKATCKGSVGGRRLEGRHTGKQGIYLIKNDARKTNKKVRRRTHTHKHKLFGPVAFGMCSSDKPSFTRDKLRMSLFTVEAPKGRRAVENANVSTVNFRITFLLE